MSLGRWHEWSAELRRSLEVAAAAAGSHVSVVTPGAAVTPLTFGAAAACLIEMINLEPRQGANAGSTYEIDVGIAIDHALLARGVPQRIVTGQSLLSRNDVTAVQARER